MIIRDNLVTVDNSALELFAICPRKFYLKCIEHMVPKKTKLALSFGGAMHAGLYEYYSGKPTKECEKAFVVEAMKEGSKIAKFAEDAEKANFKPEYSMEFGLALLGKYMKQYPLDLDLFKPLLDSDGKPYLEVGFALELEEGLYLGKMDGVGEFSNKPAIIEHKNTGQTLNSYMKWFNPNNQITGYLAAVNQYLEIEATICVANMIRVKDYKRGTPEDNDQKMFLRTIVTRRPDQIEARLRQINLQMKLIRQFLEMGKDAFYMNAPFACNVFGECEYKPVCNADGDDELVQMILDGGYRKEEWNPFEIQPHRVLGENGNGNGAKDVQSDVSTEEGRYVHGGESAANDEGRCT